MPNTVEEFAALGTYLGAQSVTGSQPGGHQQVWVGLENKGGKWLWLDDILSVRYIKWSLGEPNGDGVCATIRKDNGALNDLDCNHWKMSSVCQPRCKYSNIK